MMTTTQRQKLTEPLGTVTAVFGGFLLLLIAAGVALTLMGSGSIGGIGHTDICVDQPHAMYGGSNWLQGMDLTARRGATLSMNGTLQACANHPGFGQRFLYTLTSVPSALVWGSVVFLLWRVIRAARKTGPFTVPVAAAMRRLGWLIIAGTAAAATVQALAMNQLLNSMMVLAVPNQLTDLISEPVHALLPVPLLAGAALLTFARIIRLGVAMDDELKGTV
jgi:hypothetical protein